MWDRNATFDDMLARMSRRRRHDYESSLPRVPSNDRVVIILHTAPKMGSLTLRLACRRSLIDGCGRVSSKNRREPDGLKGGAELADIIRECDTTHHFCINREMFPAKAEIGRFANASFFHMYPFRNYDDWAISALKQIFDRGGSEQCEKEGASMDDACNDRRPELSFCKYTKARMSIALPRVAHRVDEMEESHHVVLYPYAEIDALLALFNEVYTVPLLSGSAEMHHAKRPEGTCDGSILDKFHECFAHRLDELS